MELHHPIMSKLWNLGGQTKRKKERRIYAATGTVPGIVSAEYTIGVKSGLRLRQVWRYLYFFSFFAVARDFAEVWHRQEPASKLTIYMPKRAEIPHFQKKWTDTPDRDSSGIFVCPVALSTY